MKILGIETTCDETGIAIVEDGWKVLSNVVSSSAELQKKYKGVVPEIASREQVKVIIPVLKEATRDFKPNDVGAIAVSYGPGLIGSLLVGVETAKTLALAWKKPLIPTSHLWGHVYANWLLPISNFKFQILNLPKFPLIALVVSGGHTDLVLLRSHSDYKWLGGTLDDAAGEAFDKVARFLDLGYSGGPVIEKVSKNGDPKAFDFPRPLISAKNFDFSFSGLKTAVVNMVKKAGSRKQLAISNIAASFQQAVVDVLVAKTVRAAQEFGAKNIIAGGGVAANTPLRTQLTAKGKKLGIKVNFAPLEYCGDNGAMIASAAYFNFKPKSISATQADPSLHF